MVNDSSFPTGMSAAIQIGCQAIVTAKHEAIEPMGPIDNAEGWQGGHGKAEKGNTEKRAGETERVVLAMDRESILRSLCHIHRIYYYLLDDYLHPCGMPPAIGDWGTPGGLGG